MKSDYRWWIAVGVTLAGTTVGCSSAGKQSGASLAGIKGSDKSLRTAVEKDPFPRAQAATAAARSSTTNR
jgi:hypothetical protein